MKYESVRGEDPSTYKIEIVYSVKGKNMSSVINQVRMEARYKP